MKSLTINAIVLIFLFTLINSPIVKAQQTINLLIGANSGINMSKFKFSGKDNVLFPNKSNKFGYQGAISAGIEYKRLAFITGLEFSTKGSKYATDNIYFEELEDIGFYAFNEQVNTLSVPLLLRLRLLTENFGATLTVGPKINVGLRSKVEYQVSTLTGVYEDYLRSNGESPMEEFENSFGSSINNEYNKVTSSFVISPGFFFAVGDSGRLGTNVVFDFGLSNMYNQRYLDAISDNSTVKLNTTMFTITYEHCFEMEVGKKW